MAFADPWGCSKDPTLYASTGTGKETAIITNAPTDGTAVKGEAEVTGGELKISIRSEDKAINVCYILIRPVNVKAASVVGLRGM